MPRSDLEMTIPPTFFLLHLIDIIAITVLVAPLISALTKREKGKEGKREGTGVPDQGKTTTTIRLRFVNRKTPTTRTMATNTQIGRNRHTEIRSQGREFVEAVIRELANGPIASLDLKTTTHGSLSALVTPVHQSP